MKQTGEDMKSKYKETWVDTNPLVVARALGERVDTGLIDLHPR